MGHTTIEINGKRYDAVTGSVIGESARSHKQNLKGRNLDGVHRRISGQAKLSPNRSASVTHQINASSAYPLPVPSAKTRISTDSRSVDGIHKQHRKGPQKSKILMRTVVKKPSSDKQTEIITPTATNRLTNHSYQSNISSEARLKKALMVSTHPSITKFPKPSTNYVSAHVAPLALSVEPELRVHNTKAYPVSAAKAGKSKASAFVDSQLAKSAGSSSEIPRKKRIKSKRHRIATSLSVLATVLLIAGFVAYNNLPSMSLMMAGRGAGISLHRPDGIPTNFALSRNIAYSPGQVVLSYSSRVDDRAFDIVIQKNQEGTKESLEAQIKASTNGSYQTYQINGITMYITGAGRADWIAGDMYYSVNGESGLSTEQLATIAMSL